MKKIGFCLVAVLAAITLPIWGLIDFLDDLRCRIKDGQWCHHF